MRQTLNAMDYSAVVNENPRIANLSGAETMEAHNMVMFPYAAGDRCTRTQSISRTTGPFGTVAGPGDGPNEFFIVTPDEQAVKTGEFITYSVTVEGTPRDGIVRVTNSKTLTGKPNSSSTSGPSSVLELLPDKGEAVRDRGFHLSNRVVDGLVRPVEDNRNQRYSTTSQPRTQEQSDVPRSADRCD